MSVPNNQLIRLLGTQAVRPSNAIQALHGSPYALMPRLQQALQVPIVSDAPQADQIGGVQNVPITWTSSTYDTASEIIISAQPNRVVLSVQNQSATNPIAVNYDATASISGSSPNFIAQGILLQPGVTLYVDKWCPTGTIHVSGAPNTCPFLVTQAYSSIGNIPEANLLQAMIQLIEMLTPQS